jgi:HlyD family secretion protein
MKKLIIFGSVILVLGLSVFFFVRAKSSGKDKKITRVAVEQGTIVEKALAIGSIGPKHEIVVKSQVSGIVELLYKDVGDYVEQGQPLMSVKPEPTPIELANAKRELELVVLNRANAKRELDRARDLIDKSLLAQSEFEKYEKNFKEAQVREMQVQERLELLEKGKSRIGNTNVESIIRSPVTGTILERLVNLGDPVVPLTSYQPGTELLKLADMEDLIFAGTVDEIDVGKISESMPAQVYIGALPADTLKGELYFISPKSRTKDNANVFDIRIRISQRGKSTLRAGYSANADVIIKKRENIPTLPERLISFRNDTAFVKVPADSGMAEKRIAIGLSDGIKAEVLEGLAVGDSVVEEPPKEIK